MFVKTNKYAVRGKQIWRNMLLKVIKCIGPGVMKLSNVKGQVL